MTDAIHIHDAEGHDIGYICVPSGHLYRAAIHRRHARDWEPIGKWTRSLSVAFKEIAKALDGDRKFYAINRAGVWWKEPGVTYYDPEMLYEVKRL